MTLVKDTIREFEEYLDMAKSKMDNMIEILNIVDSSNEDAMNIADVDGKQGEDDDDDGEEEEEQEDVDGYEVSEIGTLEESISLMKLSLEVLKSGLLVMTLVADKNSRALVPSDTFHCSDDTTTAATSTMAVDTVSHSENESENRKLIVVQHIDYANCDNDGYSCNQWVSDVSHYSDVLEGYVTDFGAVLYPPLNTTALCVLRSAGEILKEYLHDYISLLKKKSSFHEDAVVITDNISESLAICIARSGTIFK